GGADGKGDRAARLEAGARGRALRADRTARGAGLEVVLDDLEPGAFQLRLGVGVILPDDVQHPGALHLQRHPAAVRDSAPAPRRRVGDPARRRLLRAGVPDLDGQTTVLDLVARIVLAVTDH